MSMHKYLKIASFATGFIVSGSVFYYMYRNQCQANLEVCVLPETSLNNSNSSDINVSIDTLTTIDVNNVSISEMQEVNKMLRMQLMDSDYQRLLNMITSISSFSKNMDSIVQSGCLQTMLEILSILESKKEDFIMAVINPLKNTACYQNSLVVFRPFIKTIINNCESEILTLKFGSLSLLANLVLVPQLDNEESDCAKEILIYIDQIFTWLLDDRKDATVKLLLNLSHNGIEYRKIIMNCTKEKVFPVFLELLQQTNINVFILIRLFYEDLTTDSSFEEKTFGKYLMDNRESFRKIAEMKSLGETRDIDIVRNLLQTL